MKFTRLSRVIAPALALALAAPPTVTTAFADKDDKKDKDDDEDVVEWGVGAQARRMRVSRRTLKMFAEDGPGPAEVDGGGIVFTRRGKTLEVVIGLGYDPLDGIDGYYLEQNGDPTQPETVSYLEFDNTMWFTAEVTVVGHAMLHKILGFRYGAGLGIGVVRGDVLKTDSICTGTDLQRPGVCGPDPNGVDVEKPVQPPVLPVLNVLVGVELRPFRFLSLYADVGLHTAPYAGVGATLYLWDK